MKKAFSLVGAAILVVLILRFYSSMPSHPTISDISTPAPVPNSDGTPQPQPTPTDPGSRDLNSTPDNDDPDQPPPDPPAAEKSPDANQTQTLFATGIKIKADRRGSVNGCKGGELTLNTSSLHFDCPSDQRKNVDATIAEVKKMRKDGVELDSKGKYDFDLLGLDARQTQNLFCNWLSQQRTVQCDSQD